MVLLVVVIAIALYGVLYFNGEFLTQNHGVGGETLWTLQQMIFQVPQNTFLALFRIVIALLLVYLIIEVIVNAMRPKTQTTRRKKSLWRRRNFPL